MKHLAAIAATLITVIVGALMDISTLEPAILYMAWIIWLDKK